MSASTTATSTLGPDTGSPEGSWAALYEAPQSLSAEWGHYRIFAPIAYRKVRASRLVPIVYTEVLSLARLFPTCWTISDDGAELCVLRSLLGDGIGLPGGIKSAAAVLPKALQAYPVVVPHEETSARPILIDCAIAEHPTDAGAPLMTADGRPTRAMKTRARTAIDTGRALATTRALSRILKEGGLLEPWLLDFDLGNGCQVRIENLAVVSQARLSEPGIYRAIAAFGPEAALFLSAHRLSLFRISALLSAAKEAATSSAQAA